MGVSGGRERWENVFFHVWEDTVLFINPRVIEFVKAPSTSLSGPDDIVVWFYVRNLFSFVKSRRNFDIWIFNFALFLNDIFTIWQIFVELLTNFATRLSWLFYIRLSLKLVLLFEEIESTLWHLIVLLQFILNLSSIPSLDLKAHLQLTVFIYDLLNVLIQLVHLLIFQGKLLLGFLKLKKNILQNGGSVCAFDLLGR